MIDPRQLDELARRLGAALPGDLGRLGQDVRTNLRAALGSSLESMDLVSREEFDVQQAVLARTRERLEALEARLEALEREAAEGEGGMPPGS